MPSPLVMRRRAPGVVPVALVSGSQTAYASSGTTSSEAISFSASAVGYYRVLAASGSPSSVTGGDVTTWTLLASTPGTGGAGPSAIYGGMVTSGSGGTTTVNYGAAQGFFLEWAEFSSPLATPSWVLGASAANVASGVTNLDFPALTASQSGYFGFMITQYNNMAVGNTAGFSYLGYYRSLQAAGGPLTGVLQPNSNVGVSLTDDFTGLAILLEVS